MDGDPAQQLVLANPSNVLSEDKPGVDVD